MSDLIRQSLGADVRLKIKYPPGLRQCYVDPAQLETALLNLAINARDAMPGGGTLTIEAANAPAEALQLRDDDEISGGGISGGGTAEGARPSHAVTLSVTDTGAGMSAETLDRAFEPFFTTKPVGKGSGLGLSMVYGFARQSGGQARIFSTRGHGTTVELSLPAAGAARDTGRARRVDQQGPRHGASPLGMRGGRGSRDPSG